MVETGENIGLVQIDPRFVISLISTLEGTGDVHSRPGPNWEGRSRHFLELSKFIFIIIPRYRPEFQFRGRISNPKIFRQEQIPTPFKIVFSCFYLKNNDTKVLFNSGLPRHLKSSPILFTALTSFLVNSGSIGSTEKLNTFLKIHQQARV